MIANAEQAVEALRHKRTKQVLPTKNIARNTKLVYLHDELIGLKFHNTIIARYVPDGVIIDTRDPGDEHGWFTVTTWERIDSFTPARTFTNGGLRHIYLDPNGGGVALYMHGMKLSPEGKCERVLHPDAEEAIEHTIRNFPRQCKRFAERAVSAWKDWGQVRDCCTPQWLTEQPEEHLVRHIQGGEPTVPPMLTEIVSAARLSGSWGDRLCEQVEEALITRTRALLPTAVQMIAPAFPYPQVPRRRS